MQIDIVNVKNEKVGSLDLSDDLFAGRVRADLVWEAVVHEQAEARRGTHAAKSRSAVAGSGKKLWKQKGTGRARVSDIRNPIWRKGGVVFPPQPREYAFALPKKVRRGALREALAAKLQSGLVTVVDTLPTDTAKTKAAAALLNDLGASGKTLVLDLAVDETFDRATRNIAGLTYLAANRVSARPVADATRVIATRAALEKLQEALGA
jgi:large subunit ribosomal protein L4